MTLRLMLVPIESVVVGTITARGPKYFDWRHDPDPPSLMAGVVWQMQDFGLEPTAVLAADVSAGQITTLNGLADVTLVPANLDNQLGANLATVQAELEALNLPIDTLTATNTYRQVLRGVLCIFAIAQRFNGKLGVDGRFFPPGITLSSTLGDLSLNVRDKLEAAAVELGYNFTGLVGSSTMREVLRTIATQQSPRTLMGVSI